jgi:hypothetical protein
VNRLKLLSRRISAIAVFALLAQMMTPLLVGNASAAALTNTYVRLSRMKISTTSVDIRILFTTVGATGTNGKIFVDLDTADNNTASGYTIATSPTSTSASCTADTGATAVTVTGTVGTQATKDFVISTSTTMAATTAYCVDITAGITTMPNAGAQFSGLVKTQTSASADVDTKSVATRVVTDDQIAITAATVPPIFNMTFAANTLAFPSNTISSLVAKTDTTTTTITVSTNAASGYIVWAMSGNNNGGGKGSLSSTAASKKLTSSTAVGAASHAYSSGVEDYGLAVSSITASQGTADAAYDAIGGNAGKIGTLDATKFQPIASHTASTATAAITVGFTAGISTSTPAATDYTDTITFVGAGKF